jgi:hypothetical protein
MSLLKSARRLSVVCLLLVPASCRGGGKHHPRDAATDPSTPDGGVQCSAEAAEEGCGVVIRGEFNQCPRVSFEASPVQTRLDQGVLVSSMSVDPEGDALSFQWAAEPDGHFDDPAALMTNYRCESIGRKTIQLTVLDARGCDSQGELEVTCVNLEEFMRSGVQEITTP